jgi:hypothetical protein
MNLTARKDGHFLTKLRLMIDEKNVLRDLLFTNEKINNLRNEINFFRRTNVHHTTIRRKVKQLRRHVSIQKHLNLILFFDIKKQQHGNKNRMGN